MRREKQVVLVVYADGESDQFIRGTDWKFNANRDLFILSGKETICVVMAHHVRAVMFTTEQRDDDE